MSKEELFSLCENLGIDFKEHYGKRNFYIDGEVLEVNEKNMIKALLRLGRKEVNEITYAECFLDIFKKEGIETSLEFGESDSCEKTMVLKMRDINGIELQGNYILPSEDDRKMPAVIRNIEYFMYHSLRRFLKVRDTSE